MLLLSLQTRNEIVSKTAVKKYTGRHLLVPGEQNYKIANYKYFEKWVQI
jgi:hypothetical protein